MPSKVSSTKGPLTEQMSDRFLDSKFFVDPYEAMAQAPGGVVVGCWVSRARAGEFESRACSPA